MYVSYIYINETCMFAYTYDWCRSLHVCRRMKLAFACGVHQEKYAVVRLFSHVSIVRYLINVARIK